VAVAPAGRPLARVWQRVRPRELRDVLQARDQVADLARRSWSVGINCGENTPMSSMSACVSVAIARIASALAEQRRRPTLM